MKPLVLFLSTLTVGLMAGLFYAWSVSVMPGLKKLPDREFIMAMQSMNKAIQNPLFFIAFFGAAICLPVSCLLLFKKPLGIDYWLLAGATCIYLAGIMGVTILGNVPLNNMLEGFDINAPGESISAMRSAFENKWNTLNTVRTVSAILSFSLLVLTVWFRK
jgi:uncharacterized membrane protein